MGKQGIKKTSKGCEKNRIRPKRGGILLFQQREGGERTCMASKRKEDGEKEEGTMR